MILNAPADGSHKAAAERLFPDGAAYERVMGRWSHRVGEAFLAWLDIPAGLCWLDVGCGNGAFTEALIARCKPAAVIAIDPSEGQLAYARTRPLGKAASFRVGDAHALPFPDKTFDAASMALVIPFLTDPAKAVAEMARVVKPGGWVTAYVWDIPSGGLPLEPIRAAMAYLGIGFGRPSGRAGSRQAELRALWETAGLRTIGTCSIRVPIVYSDFDDFWESNTLPIGPVGKAIEEMAPSEIERIRLRLRDQLTIDPDGQIRYEVCARAVRGRMAGHASTSRR